MPNWVRTKVEVSSRDWETIRKLCVRKNETKDGDGDEKFDFNAIDPMPEAMNVEFGGKSDDAISLYLGKKDPSCLIYGTASDKKGKGDFYRLLILLKQHEPFTRYRPLTQDTIDYYTKKGNLAQTEGLGKHIVDNVKTYNAANWYEWALLRWGVKWNASDFSVEDDGKKATFYFDTPWSFAEKALVALSRKCPEITMRVSYADEDIGQNAGIETIGQGRVISGNEIDADTVPAYQIAFELWNCADMYHYDKKKRTFVPNED